MRTKPTGETFGTAGQSPSSGVTIRDSVLTGSLVKNIQESAPVPQGSECKKCGSWIAKGAKFCSGCGERVPAVFKKCGNSGPPVAKFCTQCGEKVV